LDRFNGEDAVEDVDLIDQTSKRAECAGGLGSNLDRHTRLVRTAGVPRSLSDELSIDVEPVVASKAVIRHSDVGPSTDRDKPSSEGVVYRGEDPDPAKKLQVLA